MQVLTDELGTNFILSRVAAVLRSNVLTAAQAASNLGLTTSTVLDGMGYTEEEYYLADYMACLLTVRRHECNTHYLILVMHV